MRRRLGSVILVLCLGGCAFSGSVQRIGVEYNDAVAGMANELTLLNILRAREDLPLHYTSVSRLSGSMTVKAGGNINAALRANATTGTNQTVTTTSASPSQAVTVIEQIAEGVDVVTPTVSGEIATGPTFDIAVLDTQKFYNGILGAVPFPTVENYIGQGYSDELLMRLLIERIDFVAADGPSKGDTLFSWKNAASGADAVTFANNIACYTLRGRAAPKKPVDLAPASRLRRTDTETAVGLTLQELALLDGKSLELSGALSTASKDDEKVMIRRPGADKRVADLKLKDEGDCRLEMRRMPGSPPPEKIYLGEGQAVTLGANLQSDTRVNVEPYIVFRSTESVIRFVGRYIRATNPDTLVGGEMKYVKVDGKPVWTRVGGFPLFAVTPGRPAGALVTSQILGDRVSIASDDNRRQNMQVIAIIQQLLNLHKESSDRPVTVPVQVVGGS